MASFFERWGYSAQTLKHDLEKMKHLSQSDALIKSNSTEEKMSRIPLILTYHPLNTRVQQILLDNFKVIADDPVTSFIFPRWPMVVFRRDDNLRTSLVHTAENQAATCAGTYPCEHPRCRTCGHISSETNLLGPWPSRIPSHACPLVWFTASPTVAALPFTSVRLGALRSINKSVPGFPVADHLSSNRRTNALVCGIKLCDWHKQRKRQEVRLIFQLGTCQLRGLNADFHFIWSSRVHAKRNFQI